MCKKKKDEATNTEESKEGNKMHNDGDDHIEEDQGNKEKKRTGEG